jgi:Glycosyltransferase family 25 (LPS biosynthesis protein)
MIDEKLLSAVLESQVELIFTSLDQLSARKLRDRLVPLRWRVQPDQLDRFISGLKAIVDAWELQGNSRVELWELEYNVFYYRGGPLKTLEWLETLVFSKEYDFWKAYVLIKGHLDQGNISIAKILIDRLVFEKMAPELRVLIALTHMYAGEFDEAKLLFGLQEGTSDIGMLRTSLKVAKITGDYNLALRNITAIETLQSDSDPTLRHIKNQIESYIAVTQEYATVSNELEVDAAYVITLNQNGQRLRRLRSNFAIFNVSFSEILGVDGNSLPKAFIDRLASPMQNDREKLVGCFASHCEVWKRIVEGSAHSAFVFEDDALIHINPKAITTQFRKEPMEFIFCGERMEGILHTPVSTPKVFALPQGLQARVLKGIIGTDMYWLTKNMAKKLLELVYATGPTHHVDRWLVDVAGKKFDGKFGLLAPSIGGEYATF